MKERTALDGHAKFKALCQSQGVDLEINTIRGGAEHWMFNRGKTRLLDYWPSTGTTMQKGRKGHAAGREEAVALAAGFKAAPAVEPPKSNQGHSEIGSLALSPIMLDKIAEHGIKSIQELADGIEKLPFGPYTKCRINDAINHWRNPGRELQADQACENADV